MLLEAGIFPLEGFPRVYLVSSLMGMLSIILHVDYKCLFALLSLLGYVEIVIKWLQVSLQGVGLLIKVWDGHNPFSIGTV
jgi:hypothetical protein